MSKQTPNLNEKKQDSKQKQDGKKKQDELTAIKSKFHRLVKKITKLEKYSNRCQQYIYNKNPTKLNKKLKNKKSTEDIIIMCDKIDTSLDKRIEEKKEMLKTINKLQKDTPKKQKKATVKFAEEVEVRVLDPSKFYYKAKKRVKKNKKE